MAIIHRLGARSTTGTGTGPDPASGGAPGDVDPTDSGAGAPLPTFSSGDVLILAGGPGWGRTVAEEALRSGARLWLGDPASWGLSDFRALLALAEESGVEAAVSRPWRVACRQQVERCRLVRIEAGYTDDFSAVLGAAIDLATWLCDTHVLQRADAEKIADPADRVSALLATIRFQNGAMAQLSLVGSDGGPSLAPSCRVAGGNHSGWHELGAFEAAAPGDNDVLEQFCAGRSDHHIDQRRAHLAEAISARVIEEKLYAVLRGV